MRFVKAQPTQFEEIFQLYQEVTQWMNDQGLYQWHDEYPQPEDIQKDIDQGHMHVLMDGSEIVAAVVLDQIQDPEYEQISWQDRSNRFLVIHRLCVSLHRQGEGISKLLLEEVEAWAKENGYTSIRLDTMQSNEIAMNLYESQGYQQRGVLNFARYREPFMAFEKNIS